ncbi:MAG: acyltransferase [Muribaculaceae bacterium]|nr:acyltransferase [Muribaculaceae bacterium]
MTHVRFDREMTSIVKGFAIFFMMLLHCYHSEGNYDVQLNFANSLTPVHTVFKICVGMFVFMVGYGYSFSKTKDFRYSVQHIKKLLIPFWTILFVLTLPVCFKEVMSDSIVRVLLNLVGIDSHYNWYSWFVYFFIYAMAVMPFFSRFINRKPVRNTAIIVIASTILAVLFHEIPRFASMFFGAHLPPIVENKPILAFFNCLLMTPGMVLGYLFAHKSYYERISITGWPRLWIAIACISVMILTLVVRHWFGSIYNFFQMDLFYAPLMIGTIVVLFNTIKCEPLRKALVKLGEVSVYMWFFHALFYTEAVRWFYQPAITIFKDINLVVIWTILITFLSSWMMKTIVDHITRLLTKSYGG